jgi:plastocyanin
MPLSVLTVPTQTTDEGEENAELRSSGATEGLVVLEMTRTPRLRRLAASAALLGALAFGACGSGDDDGAPATTDPSDDQAMASGDTVAIADFNFKPADLQVAAGTTVTFSNEDGFAHTVTAKDKSFDSGNLAEGATFEHTFEEPGTYAYLCAIHNSMTGTVTVS